MRLWKQSGDGDELMDDGLPPKALEEALRHFKQSVDAWSEAAYSRERTTQIIRRRSWRLAAGWALGCALVAGSLSGTLYERHHRLEMARQAEAARLAEQQRLIREQQARQEEEDLLAKVDSDVSRTVPSAMEPLAQLMADEESK